MHVTQEQASMVQHKNTPNDSFPNTSFLSSSAPKEKKTKITCARKCSIIPLRLKNQIRHTRKEVILLIRQHYNHL